MSVRAFLNVGDFDRGYIETKKAAADINNRRVTIGIHGKDDNRASALTNVLIGTIHEYGAGNNPERSFLRKTIDNHASEYAAYALELSGKVLDRKMDSERALGLLGEKVKADVIRTFNQNEIRPDISEARKKQKGSSTVLIDTAALKQSIDYVVRKLFEAAS